MLRLFWWLASVALMACSWALPPDSQMDILVPAGVLGMVSVGLEGSSNQLLLLQFILLLGLFGLELAIESHYGLPSGYLVPFGLLLSLSYNNLWRSRVYTLERWALQAAPIVWVDVLLFRSHIIGPIPAATMLAAVLPVLPISGLLGQKLAWGKSPDQPISQFARAERAGVLGTPLAFLVFVLFYAGSEVLGDLTWLVALALLFASTSWYRQGFGRIWALAQLACWATLVLLHLLLTDYDRTTQARYTTSVQGMGSVLRRADSNSKTAAQSQVTFVDPQGKRHVRVLAATVSGPVSVHCNPEDPEDAFTIGVEYPPYHPSAAGCLLVVANLIGALVCGYLGFFATLSATQAKAYGRQARSR